MDSFLSMLVALIFQVCTITGGFGFFPGLPTGRLISSSQTTFSSG